MKAPRDKQTYRAFVSYLAECGLEEPLRAIAKRHAVTLQETYSDARGLSIIAARVEMWYWLTTEIGRSPAEVAAIFHRDRGAVSTALKKLTEDAAQMALQLADDRTAVVKLIVREAHERRRKCG